ncbi:MAG: peptidoglycan DD-metalloendopeptidase family protein [Bacteroidales bacterium]|nr:peptidoglycan DD-metalloendopeptidase family protein [Bacteroidales bacterium]
MAKRIVVRKTTPSVKTSPTRKAITPKVAVKVKATPGVRKPVQKVILPGRLKEIRHKDFKTNAPFKFVDKGDVFETLRRLKNAPEKLDISLQPLEDGALVYHPTPGFTSDGPLMAQFSVRAVIHNKGSKTVDLDKVEIVYKKGSATLKKEIYLPADQLIIEPFYAWVWQNGREYHEAGDVVFLEPPFPSKVTLSFYFKGYKDPIKFTKDVKPYTKAFAFPFDPKDFKEDEFVTGYSMHGGGDQVFAYDVGVQAYEKTQFTDVLPGKKGDKNDHFRIWGKPVYAMADGVVLHFQKDIPNNTKLDGSDENMEKQKTDYWGSFDYGGSGNHFYIKHGDVVALYAHLQKGSLNSKLTAKGKIVKKGDLLGKAGNSGNSTGPHLHMHIKTYKDDASPEGGWFRPLLFNTGYVIGQSHYTKPGSNVKWSKLDKQGIPGLKNTACFISPGPVHPYCAYPTNWGEVCKFKVPESIYQQEFDKIWTCGYYPIWVDGFDVGGKTYFNVIFRSSKNVNWVARHNMDGAVYQDEFNKWGEAGYRLINVNSYLLKSKIRYAAVWVKDSKAKDFAYHGATLAWHEANFEKHWKAGWVPTNISCVYASKNTYVTALWEKKNTGGFYATPNMTLQGFKDAFKQYTDKEKFKLVYLDAYIKNGKPLLSGIWYKNAPNYTSWWEKFFQNDAEFQANYSSFLDKGYLTRCIAGYHDGVVSRYEGVWSK